MALLRFPPTANSIIQVDEQLEGARAWRLIPAVAVYVTFLKRDSSAPTVRLTKKRYCSACFVPDNLLGARSPVPTDQKLERVDFKRLCNQFGTKTSLALYGDTGEYNSRVYKFVCNVQHNAVDGAQHQK